MKEVVIISTARTVRGAPDHAKSSTPSGYSIKHAVECEGGDIDEALMGSVPCVGAASILMGSIPAARVSRYKSTIDLPCTTTRGIACQPVHDPAPHHLPIVAVAPPPSASCTQVSSPVAPSRWSVPTLFSGPELLNSPRQQQPLPARGFCPAATTLNGGFLFRDQPA